MSGVDSFTFHLTCPGCGGRMLPGAQTLHQSDHSAYETRCDHCCDLYRIDVTATVVEAWPVNKLDKDARRAEGASYAAQIVEANGISR